MIVTMRLLFISALCGHVIPLWEKCAQQEQRLLEAGKSVE